MGVRLNANHSQPTVAPPRAADRLNICHRWLWALMIAAMILAGGILMDGKLRQNSATEPSAALVRRLALSDLSLTPSGRAPRHRNGGFSSLDGRFCARLPRIGPQYPGPLTAD